MSSRAAFTVHVFLVAVLGACGSKDPPSAVVPPAEAAPLVKSTSCPAGPMVYLGFHGPGAPSARLWKEIKSRFPDALLVELAEGKLGVVTREPHDMNVRARHEAAAATVGWLGDVVDFPIVKETCEMTFLRPVPLPPPSSAH